MDNYNKRSVLFLLNHKVNKRIRDVFRSFHCIVQQVAEQGGQVILVQMVEQILAVSFKSEASISWRI